MANRTFTLKEAQELLPVLESLIRRAAEGKRRMEEIDAEFQSVNARVMMHGGVLLDIVPLAKLRAERDKLAQNMSDALAEITATGVQVKDLDIGLLDFPCVVDGRVVLLCWKLGEETITHWHGVDEGFAGRKPIDDKIANAGRSRRKLQ
ncbi:MAG TPA: DUF2203 domain-containing protein [Terriglobales bacterium]|nr:DUF2203 domain-containing protein [Terriglobales bacterium]